MHSRRGDHGMSMVELEQLIDALKADLSADEFVERGMSVQGTFDHIDDPVLIGPDGAPITSNAGSRIFRRPGRSCCSTARGTHALLSIV